MVNLFTEMNKTVVKMALFFDYGQRAAEREYERAVRVCKKLNLDLKRIELPWLAEITGTAIVNKDINLPELKITNLYDKTFDAGKTAEKVWVPNRNGIFVNIAAAFAEELNCSFIVTGFNKEEGETFPDNSNEFIEAVNRSLLFSTLKKVKLLCFTARIDKKEIINKAIELKVPFEEIWSCYEGMNLMCGKCESCVRLKRAIIESGAEDFLEGKVIFAD
ncbi:MAG: 7-cyano-7-deazaguanine synthase [Firmicutes bacterium]|nr:7-cyano-7-deazaguanine synthase [Bacillota bacterium]